MANWNTPRGVHLVGSIPLENSEEVFRFIAERLSPYVRRAPDGETGERLDGIEWQHGRLAASPQLTEVEPAEEADVDNFPTFALREGYTAEQIDLPNLGYAEAAIDSWNVFDRLRAEEVIPPQMRFQVSLPTPLTTTTAYMGLEDQRHFEEVYRDKLLSELGDILHVVPHDDLAIQWDCALECALLVGDRPTFMDDVESAIDARLIELSEAVPEPVELGYHICCGYRDRQHFTEPEDAGPMVRTGNALGTGLDRRLEWLHMPMPRDRTDSRYARPLADLALPPETELYLGLVHQSDGVEGARRRIQAVSEFIDEFGIATECGWGRRDPETLDALVDIHTEIAEPIAERIRRV